MSIISKSSSALSVDSTVLKTEFSQLTEEISQTIGTRTIKTQSTIHRIFNFGFSNQLAEEINIFWILNYENVPIEFIENIQKLKKLTEKNKKRESLQALYQLVKESDLPERFLKWINSTKLVQSKSKNCAISFLVSLFDISEFDRSKRAFIINQLKRPLPKSKVATKREKLWNKKTLCIAKKMGFNQKTINQFELRFDLTHNAAGLDYNQILHIHPMYIVKYDDLPKSIQLKLPSLKTSLLDKTHQKEVLLKKYQDACEDFIKWFNLSGLSHILIYPDNYQSLEITFLVLCLISLDNNLKSIEGLIAHELAHHYIDYEINKNDPLNAKAFLKTMKVNIDLLAPQSFFSTVQRFFVYTNNSKTIEKAADLIGALALRNGLHNAIMFQTFFSIPPSIKDTAEDTHPDPTERIEYMLQAHQCLQEEEKKSYIKKIRIIENYIQPTLR